MSRLYSPRGSRLIDHPVCEAGGRKPRTPFSASFHSHFSQTPLSTASIGCSGFGPKSSHRVPSPFANTADDFSAHLEKAGLLPNGIIGQIRGHVLMRIPHSTIRRNIDETHPRHSPSVDASSFV